jgi:hypothetical protein
LRLSLFKPITVPGIYKITTPLLGSEGGYLPTDAAQILLFDPIPAKAKKLGLLSIYKFSLHIWYTMKNDNMQALKNDNIYTIVPLVSLCSTCQREKV